MLRVTLEIVPFGVEAEKRVIGTVKVANVSQFGKSFADYNVELRDSEGVKVKSSTVRNYDRSGGAWKLVEKVFRKLNRIQG